MSTRLIPLLINYKNKTPAKQTKTLSKIISIIANKQFDKNERDNDNSTPLIIACENELEDVALKLIETGESNPGHVNNDRMTALIIACDKELENVALKLIETGESNPGHIYNKSTTALMTACENKLEVVALKLIETGESNPGYASEYSETTALMIACSYDNLENVALKLIETGESNPGQANKSEMTALMYACDNGLENVALELIETGESNPEQLDEDGKTALIIACENELENVALKLIETGKSNSEVISNDGNTALMIATELNLTNVISALEKHKNMFSNIIDITEDGFHTSANERMVIQDFLNEDPDNLCFEYNGQYYLTSKEELKTQLNEKTSQYLRYGCKRSGDNIKFVDDKNIDNTKLYFTMSAIFGIQVLVLNLYSYRLKIYMSFGKRYIAELSLLRDNSANRR